MSKKRTTPTPEQVKRIVETGYYCSSSRRWYILRGLISDDKKEVHFGAMDVKTKAHVSVDLPIDRAYGKLTPARRKKYIIDELTYANLSLLFLSLGVPKLTDNLKEKKLEWQI